MLLMRLRLIRFFIGSDIAILGDAHPQHLAHRAGETVHRLLVGRPIMFGFGLLHGSLLQGDLVHAIVLLGHTSRWLMQPAESPHEEKKYGYIKSHHPHHCWRSHYRPPITTCHSGHVYGLNWRT